MKQALRLRPTEAGLGESGARLANGGLVAFPTETVYGLGADATNSDAVARIYAAKGRPSFNPLIVHVPDLDAACAVARFSELDLALAQAFWPGPLTLVLPLRTSALISTLVTAGGSSVAIRVPSHPVARSVLRATGRPVAAPSANASGRLSPTSAEHVLAGIGTKIDAVLDAGPSDVGLESTIVATTPMPRLLRAGGIPLEIIEDCLAQPLRIDKDPQRPEAPGQLVSHYAPKALLRLNATSREPGEKLLGFGDVDGDLNLSPRGDLVEAAARLFDILHRIDDLRWKTVAVSPIPMTGLGRAINDRLKRAAAPRQA